MGGWKYEWAGQLPVDVYEEVVAMMKAAAAAHRGSGSDSSQIFSSETFSSDG